VKAPTIARNPLRVPIARRKRTNSPERRLEAQNWPRVFARGQALDRIPQASMVGPARLALGDCVIDLGQETLLDALGREVELRPQAYQVLRHLALNAGRLVGKDELMAAVWPGSVVTDDSLVQAIGDVRRALGEAGHRVVKTVPRRGYMLVAAAANPEVSALGAEQPRAGPRHVRRWMAVGGAAALLLMAGLLWQGLAHNASAPALADPAVDCGAGLQGPAG
jgi:DNA-binding winged helix-turn-helix (wHTH) protein